MYTWIENTFGIGDGLARGLAFAISLAVVLALFALFVFIVKRLAGGRVASVRSRQPRLAVMDTTSIDTRRRLVLIRRDNIEHLLLIGGPADVVVEQGIIRGAPVGTALPRPQPVMQAVTGQIPVADNPALPAGNLASSLPVGEQIEEEVPQDEPRAKQVVAAAKPALKESSPPSASPPQPATEETKSATPSLRARLAELKKSATPGSSKPEAAAEKTETEPRRFFKKKSAPANPEQPKVAVPTPVATAANPASVSPAGNSVPSEPDEIPPPVAEIAPEPTPGFSIASTSNSDTKSKENVSELVRKLTTPKKAAAPEPAMPRRVTPPSSGPGAKATTAFHPETRKEPAAETDTPSSDPGAITAVAANPGPSSSVASEPATKTPTPSTITADTKSLEKANPVASPDTSITPVTSGEAATPAKPAEATSNSNGFAAVQPVRPDEKSPTANKAPVIPATEARVTDFAGRALAAAKTNSTSKLVKPPEKPAVANDTPAMAELNPIEDEMAKLLDEIHGTQKA